MTITRKPKRSEPPTEKRDAIATAFIQAAERRAKEESVPAAKAAKEPKAGKADKAKVPDAAPVPAPEAKEKKAKGKKKKDKKKKEAVIIRFEDTQLAGIDAKADALGLSRAAWVRMVVARALTNS